MIFLLQELLTKFPFLLDEAEIYRSHRYQKHLCKGCEGGGNTHCSHCFRAWRKMTSLQAIPSLATEPLAVPPCLLPTPGWGGQELGMVAACFLLNLWPDLSLCKIQPIYIPFMLHKEMRQGSAVAHTYLKYFLFFFLRVVFTFSLKQGKKLAALKLAPLLYSLFLLI